MTTFGYGPGTAEHRAELERRAVLAKLVGRLDALEEGLREHAHRVAQLERSFQSMSERIARIDPDGEPAW